MVPMRAPPVVPIGRPVVTVLFEEKLIYFPSNDFDVSPETLGVAFEPCRLIASDGIPLDAWFLPAPGRRAGAQTVLMCHGNAGNISHRLDRALAMQKRLGVDVMLFDYRGFGRSEGSPSEEGTYRDALAAHGHLARERGVDPGRLLLLGESLGAAVALDLALKCPPAALVLEAPFTSIAAMARVVYPFLPASWVRTRYDNLARIHGLKAPLLIVHGMRDDTVPFAQGRAVFAAAPEPKRFLALENGGHSDAYLTGGEPYWSAWKDVLGGVETR
jgi:uncharacterized protein